MAAHVNRVMARSAACMAVRPSAAAVLALGLRLSNDHRRPQAASSAAGAGLSASPVPDATAWSAVTVGAKGSKSALSISGSGAVPGALMLSYAKGNWI